MHGLITSPKPLHLERAHRARCNSDPNDNLRKLLFFLELQQQFVLLVVLPLVKAKNRNIRKVPMKSMLAITVGPKISLSSPKMIMSVALYGGAQRCMHEF